MSRTPRMLIVVAVLVAVAVVLAAKQSRTPPDAGPTPQVDAALSSAAATGKDPGGMPRLLELGSVTCIPCKMMAPILEELRQEYPGRLQVDFIDVREHGDAIRSYRVRVIPTQVFSDASGKELFRHEGFFAKADILAKWEELGVDLNAGGPAAFERLEPAQPDRRPKDTVCYMCDGDIAQETLVVVQTSQGEVRLCSPHCYFIMYSCLTQDKAGFEEKVTVSDYATGESVPVADAFYLRGLDAETGRPWIKAFANREAADRERQAGGGSIMGLEPLRRLDLSYRCGFCDRACYPQDAAQVIAGGVRTWGCCSHCAMGVAARTDLDIEVHQPDRLTGDMVVVRTMNGTVASLEPETAVAWFGLQQKPDGTWGSAGCFHQGFFVHEQNLRTWADQHPSETGRMVTIHKVLADKMKLTPQQIMKACKIGECAPK